MPYELLLLADPSMDMLHEYLNQSDVFTAKMNAMTVGVLVLYQLDAETLEIKNIAVSPEFQGQGIGRFLIENAISMATFEQFNTVCIRTANSSIGQLCLYQKMGFELSEIEKNFFTSAYPEPIYENGIQAKHRLVLQRRVGG